MKVYESTNKNKSDFKKVPQIKIKNSMMENSGFQIGKEFSVIYEQGKITLVLIQNKNQEE